MSKRKLLLVNVIAAIVVIGGYSLYVRASIRSFDIYDLVAYTAYPEKLATEEFVWVPSARTVLLNELARRSSADLLDSLRTKGINAYFIISWADLDLDGEYERERLAPLLRLLDILDEKGFDVSFLSESGCSAFHEAAIHEDVTAMGILRERYPKAQIEGNLEAQIPACRQDLLIE